MKTIDITTSKKDQMIDITSEVAAAVVSLGIVNGSVLIFIPHTTAAVTINENADPDVCTDMIKGLNSLAFNKLNFAHLEGNSDAHIKSTLVGCSIVVPVVEGKLVLGTWQSVYFCEFDGPRKRKFHVSKS